MTRSIGDFDLKNKGVIAQPETKRVSVCMKIDLQKHFNAVKLSTFLETTITINCCYCLHFLQLHHVHDSFLALTTDGINFIMNSQEICDVINQCHDPREAAQRISDQVRHSCLAQSVM